MKTTTQTSAARGEYETLHAAFVEATLDDFAAPCAERVATTREAMEQAWARYLVVRRAECNW